MSLRTILRINILVFIQALLIHLSASADTWVGTEPFCGGEKKDCTSRGMDYIKSSGKGCTTGKKVLCRNKPDHIWLGTAPACNVSAKDCHDRGMTHVKTHKSGDGKKCLSGNKVLCRPWKSGDQVITYWNGTAPLCDVGPLNCNDKHLYTGSDKKGDGDSCKTGQKIHCQTPSLTDDQLANWMKYSKDGFLGNRKISQIVMPGTHDSGSSTITSSSSRSPDLPSFPELGTVDRIIAAWGKSQSYSVSEQLNKGARSIDLRLCKKGNEYFTCHGKYGESLQSVLTAISNFSRTHTYEVILVHVTHFYISSKPKNSNGFSDDDHKAVMNLIYQTFDNGRMMVDDQEQIPTFKQIWKNSARIIVLYKGNTDLVSNIKPKLWKYQDRVNENYRCLSNDQGWTNKTKLHDDQVAWLRSKTNIEGCKIARIETKFNQLTGVLTPKPNQYAKALNPWAKDGTLLEVNTDLNAEIAEWILKTWRTPQGFILPIDAYGQTTLHEAIIKMYLP